MQPLEKSRSFGSTPFTKENFPTSLQLSLKKYNICVSKRYLPVIWKGFPPPVQVARLTPDSRMVKRTLYLQTILIVVGRYR